MAKSQESFAKKEKEKKRRKKKQEKREKREARKLAREETGKVPFEDLIRYVDENGNLVKEKPDPKNRTKIKLEDIVLGAAPQSGLEANPNRRGKVKFFNDEKGYGFIVDSETKDSIFVHINSVVGGELRDQQKVTFQIEQGPKGLTAVNVELVT